MNKEALEPEEYSCYAEILSIITWLGNVLHHIILKKHYRPVLIYFFSCSLTQSLSCQKQPSGTSSQVYKPTEYTHQTAEETEVAVITSCISVTPMMYYLYFVVIYWYSNL
jgi:hypothetical protein